MCVCVCVLECINSAKGFLSGTVSPLRNYFLLKKLIMNYELV